MIVRLELQIDDMFWPSLKLVGTRVNADGQRIAFDDKKQYDLAYTSFENALHNQLRPAVEQLIQRRKQNP